MSEVLGLYHDRIGDWFPEVVLNLCNWNVPDQSAWDKKNGHNGVETQ